MFVMFWKFCRNSLPAGYKSPPVNMRRPAVKNNRGGDQSIEMMRGGGKRRVRFGGENATARDIEANTARNIITDDEDPSYNQSMNKMPRR